MEVRISCGNMLLLHGVGTFVESRDVSSPGVYLWMIISFCAFLMSE